jgi:aryl-alcohol dehydrogenase-like predicted oxidoreductase
MRYNEVGTSGIKVSALGMGCWSYGGGAYWGNQSQKDVENVVAAALDRGVNFFDTAEMYNDGESEKALALALKGRRKEAIVASKISPPNAGKVRDHVLGSLKRLGADYLDLYMLHWPINAAALEHFAQDREKLEHPPTIESAYRQMEDCKKEGLVRCIGMSNFGVSQMKEITGAGIRVDFNEMRTTLFPAPSKLK